MVDFHRPGHISFFYLLYHNITSWASPRTTLLFCLLLAFCKMEFCFTLKNSGPAKTSTTRPFATALHRNKREMEAKDYKEWKYKILKLSLGYYKVNDPNTVRTFDQNFSFSLMIFELYFNLFPCFWSYYFLYSFYKTKHFEHYVVP